MIYNYTVIYVLMYCHLSFRQVLVFYSISQCLDMLLVLHTSYNLPNGA